MTRFAWSRYRTSPSTWLRPLSPVFMLIITPHTLRGIGRPVTFVNVVVCALALSYAAQAAWYGIRRLLKGPRRPAMPETP